MDKVTPVLREEATIKDWLLANLHDVINDLEVIPLISFNLPSEVGRVNVTQVTSINSIELTGVHLVSLSYSKVEATISVSPNISMDISWEDYHSSPEVRELLGESETEFAFISLNTQVSLTIKIHFELLKEPPMVATHQVLSARGSCGECSFSQI